MDGFPWRKCPSDGRMTPAGSAAPKTAAPTTRISAPSRIRLSAFSGLIPPSTSIGMARFCSPIQLPELPDFLARGFDEFLTSESRIHGHHEDIVEILQDVVEKMERCRWVKGDAGLRPGSLIRLMSR